EQRAELDAITIVGAIQFTQNTIMRPIVNRKYQKKFSEAEINKLEKIADKQLEDYTPDEISLKNKFERLMVNRDKLMGKIPLTDEQEKDLIDIWKRDFEVTGKSIPPWLGVAIASVNTIGSRIIDIAFD